MNVKDLYDTVILTSDCSHNTFLTHLDTTINYLVGKYGVSKVIQGGAGYQRPRTVDTDIPIYDEYRAAICDNLLYLITGDSDRKTDFVNEADFAYNHCIVSLGIIQSEVWAFSLVFLLISAA